MKTKITISGVESNNGRIVLKSNDNKSYSFFQTKQDGSPTTASDGYHKIRPMAGDTVIAEVNEKPGVSKTGAPIVFRNIAWFYTDGAQMEQVQHQSNTFTDELPTIRVEDIGDEKTELQKIKSSIEQLEKRLSAMEMVVMGVGDSESPDQSMSELAKIPF